MLAGINQKAVSLLSDEDASLLFFTRNSYILIRELNFELERQCEFIIS